MDGIRLRDEMTEQLAAEMISLGSPRVCLGTVLVGDDRPSQIYVRSKHKQAEKAGMVSQHIGFTAAATQAEVEDAVAGMAADPDIHGILVQLPLPEGLDPEPVLDLVPPEKDIDGLTERSMGRLLRGRPGHVPCTPKGVMRLLARYGTDVSGSRAVVIGRSTLVGLPMSLLLARAMPPAWSACSPSARSWPRRCSACTTRWRTGIRSGPPFACSGSPSSFRTW